MVQAGGHWAGPRKKEFLVKSFLEHPLKAGSRQRAVSAGVCGWLCEPKEQSWGQGCSRRRHWPGLAPDEALGSAVTASQTCLLTSLPSQALGSQENPGRGMRSQKRQEDRPDKGLRRDPHHHHRPAPRRSGGWGGGGGLAESSESSKFLPFSLV